MNFLKLGFIFLFIGVINADAQTPVKLVNTQYELELKKDATVLVTYKKNGRKYLLYPHFTIAKRIDNPLLKYINRSDKFAPKTNNNFLRLAYWQKDKSAELTADFYEAAAPTAVTALTGKLIGNKVQWNFPANNEYSLSATVSLISAVNEPVIEYHFVPKIAAYYSIGYTGMPEISPESADAIWQPWVWQEKRFPEKSFLSTEDMCGLPGTMVEKDGMTYGVFADPTAIPYRLPDQRSGKIKFGVLVRNQKGLAQPQIFAPVFGNSDSKLPVGQDYSFRFRVFMYDGKQPDAYIAAAKTMFGFKDYRQNVFVNINQTIENTIDFQMDDIFSRWSTEMKGYDYSTDVANTVKNVSALHPLSTAIITDNQGIYTRRALPIIEYLISREKYLFSVDKNITRQQPSSRMTGPAVEVSELAVLDLFYHGKSQIFSYLADSLSHTTRKLNLNKDSKGDDWPNLLSLYKMTGETKFLTAAKQKADAYINSRVKTLQTDFSDANTEKSGMFWTDFSPLWMEMLSLYENTKEQRYLDAAVVGAKQYMQYTWFYPVIPNGDITINENNMPGHLADEAIREKIPAMSAAKQTVPAWRVSQIGLTPEASYTFHTNPGIFLTNQAPHLLRLAYYTKDPFFRSVARSAVVGRYANYPGYDINGEFNTIYARPDYPLRFQHEVSYNQFYYNHVWPQISMLFDYLISDAFTSSKGAINFPAEFAAGYAYLKSNVYGQKPGKFYGDENVNLWMPKQVLKISNEQANYITAYGNNKFYIALLNQSDKVQEVEISINPDMVPVNLNGTHATTIWMDNVKASPSQVKNGKIKVKINPKGITALAINDIHVITQFQSRAASAKAEVGAKNFKINDSPLGSIKSTIFSLGDLSNAYIWMEASNEKLKDVTFNYRVGDKKEWIKQIDNSYPFEFSLALKEGETRIEYFVEGTTINSQKEKSEIITLQK